MREPVLSDRILLSVEKPARYIGNELNSVQKDKDKVDIRFAMCFPDVYEIGMSACRISESRLYMNSSTDALTPGVSASIRRGRTSRAS